MKSDTKFSADNPYAKRIRYRSKLDSVATHECRVCDWLIPSNRMLCDEHYELLPVELRPKKGMTADDYDKISAYWWDQVHNHGYVPPVDRRMKL